MLSIGKGGDVDEFDTFNGSVIATGDPAIEQPAVRRHRTRFVVVAIVLALVIAGVVLGTSGPHNSSAGAAAIVRDALSSTLATDSIAYSSRMTISTAGQTMSATGTGACDLTTNDCDMTLNYEGALSALGTAHAVLSGGVLYVEFGGTIASQLPTPWISLPLSISSKSSTFFSSGDPLASLSILARQGAVVTNEGSVTLNGASVNQYQVTLSATTVHHLVKKYATTMPAWLSTSASSVTSGAMTETVDVNAAGKLALIEVSTSDVADGQTVSVTSTSTVTGFGVPVNVSVPPASQVTSLASQSALNSL